MSSPRPLIFVSCGQYTAAEKKLGTDICALLSELRPDLEACFAEDQSTAEGLSAHVLRALHKAAGFICVMHARGESQLPDGKTRTRGSVWVEQEFAIIAFAQNILGRTIPILFYKHADVGLEGIRSVLLANARLEFQDDQVVLGDLRTALPEMTFLPFHEYELEPRWVRKTVNHGNSGERHDYTLTVDVWNVGQRVAKDFRMLVYFPRPFLNRHTTFGPADDKLSTRDHVCFKAESSSAHKEIYPGYGLINPLRIDYYVDDKLFDDDTAMNMDVSVLPQKSQKVLIRSIQEF